MSGRMRGGVGLQGSPWIPFRRRGLRMMTKRRWVQGLRRHWCELDMPTIKILTSFIDLAEAPIARIDQRNLCGEIGVGVSNPGLPMNQSNEYIFNYFKQIPLGFKPMNGPR